MVCVSEIWTKVAALKYRYTSSGNLAGDLSSWLGAMTYFLRKYTTQSPISDVARTLYYIRQTLTATEMHLNPVLETKNLPVMQLTFKIY